MACSGYTLAAMSTRSGSRTSTARSGYRVDPFRNGGNQCLPVESFIENCWPSHQYRWPQRQWRLLPQATGFPCSAFTTLSRSTEPFDRKEPCVPSRTPPTDQRPGTRIICCPWGVLRVLTACRLPNIILHPLRNYRAISDLLSLIREGLLSRPPDENSDDGGCGRFPPSKSVARHE